MNRKVIFVLCALCIGLVGLADYLTGYEIVLGPFYLLPVIAAAFFVSPAASVIMAVFGLVAWCVARELLGEQYSHWYVYAWNAGMRLFSSLIVAVLASMLGRVLGLDNLGEEPHR